MTQNRKPARIDDAALDTVVGGSNHSGGVNLALGDGSVRFATASKTSAASGGPVVKVFSGNSGI